MGNIPVINVLVATNSLKKFGGTESYTYTIIEELVRLKIDVEYFTFVKGIISEKIELDLGIKFMSKTNYCLILANHRTCVEKLFDKGFTIQTCHGIFPKLEKPSFFADKHVSISEEISSHLLKQGIKSDLIRNGINCDRFIPKTNINQQLTSILSLCHGANANILIKEVCSDLGIRLITKSKYQNGVWNLEDLISQVDLVIGLGRSALEAMACGRPVIVYDSRSYMDECGDGYVYNILEESKKYNYSGRFYNNKYDKELLIHDIHQYSNSHGKYLVDYIRHNFNIKEKIEVYLSIERSIQISYSEHTLRIMIQIYKKIFGKKSLMFLLLKAKYFTPKWIKKAY